MENNFKGAAADATYKQEERDVDNEQQDCGEEQVSCQEIEDILTEKVFFEPRFDSPADYIQYLSNPELSLQKKYSCIER